ncbi:hypothetical protein AVEN_59852-1 [Araneus ventricosus]|uniref:Uncharacterized protein n=1 Tax=Araneus ventricosus TaxID=182803 RepID=A0A4Y2PLD4_ARAVE|nr:hypothetical protein AVEN_226566-1 [Araneus ventricosus]GBN51019.1 hypothetical protein AVEN_59852-1 [Araneus ventricosus]
MDPICINCGEKGHLAAWKGCKALPIIKKPSARQSGKTYAQAATGESKKEEKTEERSAEKNTDVIDDMTELKDSLQALKEMKTLLQEFLTLLEAARLCRKTKTRQEKHLKCRSYHPPFLALSRHTASHPHRAEEAITMNGSLDPPFRSTSFKPGPSVIFHQARGLRPIASSNFHRCVCCLRFLLSCIQCVFW